MEITCSSPYRFSIHPLHSLVFLVHLRKDGLFLMTQILMTRQQALDRFHDLLKLRRLSDRTHKNYHLWVSRFLDFTQVEDIKTLTMEDAQDDFIHLHSTGKYKDRTFNAAVDSIRYFYSVILGIQLTGRQLGKRKVPIIQKNTISPQQAAQLLRTAQILSLKQASLWHMAMVFEGLRSPI